MAKLLMGAIVTKASGRLNGHCFRVFRNTQILQRNPLPSRVWDKAKNTFTNSVQLAFSRWSTLSAVLRSSWNEEAVKFEFPNRWGVPVVLSGRDFFTKCYLNALKVGLDLPDISAFSGIVPNLNYTGIVINVDGEVFDIEDLEIGEGAQLLVSIRKISGDQVNLTAKQIKNIAYCDASLYDKNSFYETIMATGFRFIKDKWYAVNIVAVSPSGFVSPPFITNVLVNEG
jgi:hypothetical protein